MDPVCVMVNLPCVIRESSPRLANSWATVVRAYKTLRHSGPSDLDLNKSNFTHLYCLPGEFGISVECHSQPHMELLRTSKSMTWTPCSQMDKGHYFMPVCMFPNKERIPRVGTMLP